MTSIPEKKCADCQHLYPATSDHFSRNKQTKDGWAAYCKGCMNARNKKWRDNHPEQWEQINRSNVKQWRIDNPDKAKAQVSRRNKHSPGAIAVRRKAHRKWQLKYPEKNRAKALRYIARKYGAEGSHTAEDVALIYKSQKGLCWWCGKAVGNHYHVDHRIALSIGGSDYPSNLCISCPSCNSSKGNKTPWQFDGRLI